MPLAADSLRSLYSMLVVAAIAVAGLVLGQKILIPLAVSACLAFILAPIVNWLSARRVPHEAAVVALIFGMVVMIAGLSTIFATQIISLTGSLTTYQTNLIAKVRTLVGTTTQDGAIKRAADAIDALEKSIKNELKTPADRMPETSNPAEKVVVAERSAFGWNNADEVLNKFASAGLTLLFTLFMLLQANDLRDRVVRIAGTDNVSGTTAALGDAAERLSKVFLAQAVMNAGFGIVVGVALWLIGIPNSALWGALAFLMRFVPYIGSFIAAVPPILLAAAVDPGWSMAIAALVVFIIGEAAMGQVVEPFFLGPQAGLSPFAMLISASFWALIWGPVGLLLAAPLTMTLVVLGRYIKGLEFLTVLLGDEPALTPAQQLYHRLLSDDTLAAIQQLDAAAEKQSLAEVADEIILPALRLAASDFERGKLDRERATEIKDNMSEVTAEIETQQTSAAAAEHPEDFGNVLVIAARTAVDLAAVDIVVRAARLGISTDIIAASHSTGLSALSQAASTHRVAFDAVVIVSTSIADRQYVPLIARRATQSFPQARIMLLDSGAGNLEKPERVTRYSKLSDLLAQISHLSPERENITAPAA